MSDLTANIWNAPARDVDDITLPKPVPFDAPVLISDCASPLAGETILSLLLRRLDDQP